MTKNHLYGLEVEFPSISIDQLAEYATRYAMVKDDTDEYDVFLHYLISLYEEIGLEPNGDRMGRSIYLCTFLDEDDTTMSGDLSFLGDVIEL